MQDKTGALEFNMLVKDLGSDLQKLINSTDTCSLAFGSMIIRSDIRTGCVVAVLQDRVIAAWKKGLFKKTVQHVSIPRSAIVSAASSPDPRLGRNVRVFKIKTASDELVFALPTDAWQSAESALLAALGPPSEPADPSPPPALGASGRPVEIEEGIARWFAFRRGEISQDQVGMGAMALVRWMTDEEKAEDTRLLELHKKRR